MPKEPVSIETLKHDSATRRNIPDCIVEVDDGRPEPLDLIGEIKGF